MFKDKNYLSPTRAIYSEGLRREELSSPLSQDEEEETEEKEEPEEERDDWGKEEE